MHALNRASRQCDQGLTRVVLATALYPDGPTYMRLLTSAIKLLCKCSQGRGLTEPNLGGEQPRVAVAAAEAPRSRCDSCSAGAAVRMSPNGQLCAPRCRPVPDNATGRAG